MIIYHASHESRHFSFEAFGLTADEAIRAVVRALTQHKRQTPGATADWLAEAIEDAREGVTPYTVGVGYRDGSPCDPQGTT